MIVKLKYGLKWYLKVYLLPYFKKPNQILLEETKISSIMTIIERNIKIPSKGNQTNLVSNSMSFISFRPTILFYGYDNIPSVSGTWWRNIISSETFFTVNHNNVTLSMKYLIHW